MKILCHSSADLVKDGLFEQLSDLSCFDGFDEPHLRLSKAFSEYEKYRGLLEKAVDNARYDGALAEYRKQPQETVPSLFPDDASRGRIHSVAPGCKPRLNRAGRPRLDPVMMFKAICLGELYKMSDEKLSFKTADSITFKKILGLGAGEVLSRQSIWKYREIFTNSNCFELINIRYLEELQQNGIVPKKSDLMIDASFVEAPIQRNTRLENAFIKEGKGKALWLNEPAKKRQKDIDASWTKKNGISYYGFKLHALADVVSKIVIHHVTTPAHVHDSRLLEQMLSEDDAGGRLYADAAYYGRELLETIRSFGMIPEVCEKGYKNKPLNETQKRRNKVKSRTRSRIEHVFGYIENTMGGSIVRCIGLQRASARQALTVFLYNVARVEQIQRLSV